MKKFGIAILLLIAIALLGYSRVGIPGMITSQAEDWVFIESVGGMKVELAGDRLHVACNVSGTESITTKPTTQNSGMGVRKLKCSRSGNTIHLTVVTSVLEKGMSAECGSVDVSDYPPGSYELAYLDPDGTSHLLGTVALPGVPAATKEL